MARGPKPSPQSPASGRGRKPELGLSPTPAGCTSGDPGGPRNAPVRIPDRFSSKNASISIIRPEIRLVQVATLPTSVTIQVTQVLT